MSENPSKAEHCDIAIIGAGLVGASLAVGLCQRHPQLNVVVVDAGKPPSLPEQGFDPRVVALTKHSERLFENLGVWAEIASPDADHHACPYTHMHVWDGEGTGEIDFDSGDLHQDNLGHIVENALILKHLLAKFKTLPNLTLRREGLMGIELVARQRLSLNTGEALSAQLVLAADGANSPSRTLCGFETREWNYGHRAIVTTVKTEKSHAFTAWQRFSHHGPLAFLPLLGPAGNDHQCSIVWSLDEEQAEVLMALDDARFAEQLAESFEYTLGAVEAVDPRFCFPLRQRHAKSYVKPGVALLGDAAHTIHPLAGQGVNLGLLDVVALVAEIDRAMERGIPLDDFSILRRYQRARLGPNLAMMGLMEGFKQLFGSNDSWLQLLRNVGMSQINHLPLLKTALAQRAMGV